MYELHSHIELGFSGVKKALNLSQKDRRLPVFRKWKIQQTVSLVTQNSKSPAFLAYLPKYIFHASSKHYERMVSVLFMSMSFSYLYFTFSSISTGHFQADMFEIVFLLYWK